MFGLLAEMPLPSGMHSPHSVALIFICCQMPALFKRGPLVYTSPNVTTTQLYTFFPAPWDTSNGVRHCKSECCI